MQRRYRLSRSRDFDAVYRAGRSISTRHLVLYWFPREDPDAEPRLGIAVPRAAGNAVARNRLKRQLREAFLRAEAALPAGTDYVVIARPGLAEAIGERGFDWLVEELTTVAVPAGTVRT